MHSIDERKLLTETCKASHGLVCQQHTLLDQPVRVEPLFLQDVRGEAFGVELELGLARVEVEAARLSPDLCLLLRQGVQRRKQLDIVPPPGVEDALRLFVREPARAPDDALLQRPRTDLAVAIDVHEDAVRQPVLPGPQTAEIVRQPLGKHRDDFVHEVGAGARA